MVLLCQFLVLAITTRKIISSSHLSGELCCCISFWFWQEIGIFFVVVGKFYYDREKKVLVACLAGCAVVSVFGSGDYDRKKKVQVICLAGCAVASVFGSGGKKAVFCCGRKVFLLWREILLRPEKKVPVVCLAGCAVVSVFDSSDYDRKKKVLVVCLAGCAVVSVFGSGGK